VATQTLKLRPPEEKAHSRSLTAVRKMRGRVRDDDGRAFMLLAPGGVQGDDAAGPALGAYVDETCAFHHVRQLGR